MHPFTWMAALLTKIEKAKKFALRPGNHDIEVRDSDNRALFQEKVQIIVGKTTELHVG